MIPIIWPFEFSIRGDCAWVAIIRENGRRANEDAIPKRCATVDECVILNLAICADHDIGIYIRTLANDAVLANLRVLTHLHVVPDPGSAAYVGGFRNIRRLMDAWWARRYHALPGFLQYCCQFPAPAQSRSISTPIYESTPTHQPLAASVGADNTVSLSVLRAEWVFDEVGYSLRKTQAHAVFDRSNYG